MLRGSFKSIIPKIPLKIWRPLYAWADELRGLALWEVLGDAEPLGVNHPETSERMLGAMMGRLGQVFGLALHCDPEGVRYALEVAVDDLEEPDMEEFRLISVLTDQVV